MIRITDRILQQGVVLAVSCVLCFCVSFAEEYMNDNGEIISEDVAELMIDEDLYDMWRHMDQSSNPLPPLIANSVASHRERISRILLSRINTWMDAYIQEHTNQVPATLSEMAATDKTCPVTQQEFAYFPITATNRVAELVVATVPRSISFQAHSGTIVYVCALLGNGEIRDFHGSGFSDYANSNNVLRTALGLPTIPTNLIWALSHP
jgi:hypothetical protein